MVKKKVQEPVEANLSTSQMADAVPKIERRLAELNTFDLSTVERYGDPKVQALESKLESLLVSIFGVGTVEYERYRYVVASINPMTFWPDMSIYEIRNGVSEGIERSKQQLETIKSIFQEELEDSGASSGGKSLKAYSGLELHPAIERAVGSLYKNGHYANAIEDAVKALNALVRMNSGVDDRDGTVLMEYVFSPKTPILKFNALTDTSDLEEQKGFMMMFSGAVAGLRNPRAHKIIKDDPEKSLEFIAFISLLAKLADKSFK